MGSPLFGQEHVDRYRETDGEEMAQDATMTRLEDQ